MIYTNTIQGTHQAPPQQIRKAATLQRVNLFQPHARTHQKRINHDHKDRINEETEEEIFLLRKRIPQRPN